MTPSSEHDRKHAPMESSEKEKTRWHRTLETTENNTTERLPRSHVPLEFLAKDGRTVVSLNGRVGWAYFHPIGEKMTADFPRGREEGLFAARNGGAMAAGATAATASNGLLHLQV